MKNNHRFERMLQSSVDNKMSSTTDKDIRQSGSSANNNESNQNQNKNPSKSSQKSSSEDDDVNNEIVRQFGSQEKHSLEKFQKIQDAISKSRIDYFKQKTRNDQQNSKSSQESSDLSNDEDRKALDNFVSNGQSPQRQFSKVRINTIRSKKNSTSNKTIDKNSNNGKILSSNNFDQNRSRLKLQQEQNCEEKDSNSSLKQNNLMGSHNHIQDSQNDLEKNQENQAMYRERITNDIKQNQSMNIEESELNPSRNLTDIQQQKKKNKDDQDKQEEVNSDIIENNLEEVEKEQLQSYQKLIDMKKETKFLNDSELVTVYNLAKSFDLSYLKPTKIQKLETIKQKICQEHQINFNKFIYTCLEVEPETDVIILGTSIGWIFYFYENTIKVFEKPSFLVHGSNVTQVTALSIKDDQILAGFSDGHIVLYDQEDLNILKIVDHHYKQNQKINLIKFFPQIYDKKQYFFVSDSSNCVYTSRFTQQSFFNKKISYTPKVQVELEDYINSLEIDTLFNFIAFTDQKTLYIKKIHKSDNNDGFKLYQIAEIDISDFKGAELNNFPSIKFLSINYKLDEYNYPTEEIAEGVELFVGFGMEFRVFYLKDYTVQQTKLYYIHNDLDKNPQEQSILYFNFLKNDTLVYIDGKKHLNLVSLDNFKSPEQIEKEQAKRKKIEKSRNYEQQLFIINAGDIILKEKEKIQKSEGLIKNQDIRNTLEITTEEQRYKEYEKRFYNQPYYLQLQLSNNITYKSNYSVVYQNDNQFDRQFKSYEHTFYSSQEGLILCLAEDTCYQYMLISFEQWLENQLKKCEEFKLQKWKFLMYMAWKLYKNDRTSLFSDIFKCKKEEKQSFLAPYIKIIIKRFINCTISQVQAELHNIDSDDKTYYQIQSEKQAQIMKQIFQIATEFCFLTKNQNFLLDEIYSLCPNKKILHEVLEPYIKACKIKYLSPTQLKKFVVHYRKQLDLVNLLIINLDTNKVDLNEIYIICSESILEQSYNYILANKNEMYIVIIGNSFTKYIEYKNRHEQDQQKNQAVQKESKKLIKKTLFYIKYLLEGNLFLNEKMTLEQRKKVTLEIATFMLQEKVLKEFLNQITVDTLRQLLIFFQKDVKQILENMNLQNLQEQLIQMNISRPNKENILPQIKFPLNFYQSQSIFKIFFMIIKNSLDLTQEKNQRLFNYFILEYINFGHKLNIEEALQIALFISSSKEKNKRMPYYKRDRVDEIILKDQIIEKIVNGEQGINFPELFKLDSVDSFRSAESQKNIQQQQNLNQGQIIKIQKIENRQKIYIKFVNDNKSNFSPEDQFKLEEQKDYDQELAEKIFYQIRQLKLNILDTDFIKSIVFIYKSLNDYKNCLDRYINNGQAKIRNNVVQYIDDLLITFMDKIDSLDDQKNKFMEDSASCKENQQEIQSQLQSINKQKEQYEGFKNIVIDFIQNNIPKLLEADQNYTKFLLEKYCNLHFEQLVFKLKESQMDKLCYKLLNLKFYENYPNHGFNNKLLKLYFEEMCIIDKQNVIDNLKKGYFQDIYSNLFQICEKTNCLAGKSFIQDKGGDSKSAILTYYELGQIELNSVLKRQDIVNLEDLSQEKILATPQLNVIQYTVIQETLRICISNSQNENEGHQQLWLVLLDKLIGLQQGIKAGVQKLFQKAFEQVVNAMFSYLDKKEVIDSISHILQQQVDTKNLQENLRNIIHNRFQSCKFEKKLSQHFTEQLLKQQYGKRDILYYKQAKAQQFRKGICQKCGFLVIIPVKYAQQMIELECQPRDRQNIIKLNQMYRACEGLQVDFKYYFCGHLYHKECDDSIIFTPAESQQGDQSTANETYSQLNSNLQKELRQQKINNNLQQQQKEQKQITEGHNVCGYCLLNNVNTYIGFEIIKQEQKQAKKNNGITVNFNTTLHFNNNNANQKIQYNKNLEMIAENYKNKQLQIEDENEDEALKPKTKVQLQREKKKEEMMREELKTQKKQQNIKRVSKIDHIQQRKTDQRQQYQKKQFNTIRGYF